MLRWRWSFWAEERRVSGTFLFPASCLRSAGIRRGSRCRVMSMRRLGILGQVFHYDVALHKQRGSSQYSAALPGKRWPSTQNFPLLNRSGAEIAARRAARFYWGRGSAGRVLRGRLSLPIECAAPHSCCRGAAARFCVSVRPARLRRRCLRFPASLSVHVGLNFRESKSCCSGGRRRWSTASFGAELGNGTEPVEIVEQGLDAVAGQAGADAGDHGRRAGNIFGERVGHAGLFAKIFRAIGISTGISVGTGERGDKRRQRLGGDAVMRGFGDGRRVVHGEDGEHLGEIRGRQRQGTGNDVDFLFRRRLSGTNRGAEVGANGRLPEETANLFG